MWPLGLQPAMLSHARCNRNRATYVHIRQAGTFLWQPSPVVAHGHRPFAFSMAVLYRLKLHLLAKVLVATSLPII